MKNIAIAIANQKGGTGKTTTAVNLGAGLARYLGPNKVLLVDTDTQSNSTLTFLGPEIPFGGRRDGVYTILDVYEQNIPVEQAIHKIALDGRAGEYPSSRIHILPAQIELAAIESSLNTGLTGLFILRNAIKELRDKYHVILVDCPASLGAFTMSALLACDYLIVPVIPGQYEFAGLRSLLETVKRVGEFDPIQIIGVLPTRIKHTNIAKDVISNLEDFFGIELILPPVQDRVALEEAHFAGQDIFTYAPDSPSAKQYGEVLRTLLQRLGLTASGENSG
jgi:chromosome partitioning protein